MTCLALGANWVRARGRAPGSVPLPAAASASGARDANAARAEQMRAGRQEVAAGHLLAELFEGRHDGIRAKMGSAIC